MISVFNEYQENFMIDICIVAITAYFITHIKDIDRFSEDLLCEIYDFLYDEIIKP